jgi:hypothetical protein
MECNKGSIISLRNCLFTFIKLEIILMLCYYERLFAHFLE